MQAFSIRSFFRNLNGVKYYNCPQCSLPVPSASPDSHLCAPATSPLPYACTNLTFKKHSVYFLDKTEDRGWIRSLAIWRTHYITAIQVVFEDIGSKTSKIVQRGTPADSDTMTEIEFSRGEFICELEYGSDVHGLYALRLHTNYGRTFEIGSTKWAMRRMEIPNGRGIVGVFGAHQDLVLHLGFFFDDIKEVNFLRNRELLLIRYKGQVPVCGGNDEKILEIIKKFDFYLLRYFAKFI